ncbi:hypothetical protein D8M05_18515 [Oceanobacillus bengalensis]|uniref:Uncharacterized protein n=2 Tax=Oceanobacillus bengalensis TaxID=1435466 RepID=A0A494YRU3_9BACI|nr:hypothetical protein [Oceanobacillus bengalensis]RKQ12312.1 hypothetical protein D8M05_18515 [Oceanobacillus bengalensis]
MGVYAYIIYALDHNIQIQRQLYQPIVPLAHPTAVMLDSAATQLVNNRQVQAFSQSLFLNGGMFSHLSREDRIRTLSALDNLSLDLYLLPSPFQNNAGLIKFVVDALNRFAMFGYYSEWPAYGTTRLNQPNNRKLEYFPLTWQKIGYPGVSFGYRAFRGFLFTMDEVEGGNENRS